MYVSDFVPSNIYNTVLKPSKPAIDLNKIKELDDIEKLNLKKINWDWEICITPNMSSKKPERFSLMIGIFVSSGMHINYIEELLIKQFLIIYFNFTE